MTSAELLERKVKLHKPKRKGGMVAFEVLDEEAEGPEPESEEIVVVDPPPILDAQAMASDGPLDEPEQTVEDGETFPVEPSAEDAAKDTAAEPESVEETPVESEPDPVVPEKKKKKKSKPLSHGPSFVSQSMRRRG